MKKKKILFILLSFLIPFFSLIAIFYINGLFNENTIMTGDMQVQYYPLFNYYKDILNGVQDIFYSFNKSLGGTMFGTFFYYLSSPFNLLLFFVSKTQIPLLVTLLIIIKISLCGTTMYIYLSKKAKKDNIIVLIFSLCYSLMGYNINYFINIMWLDIVLLTPLVIIGLEKIINNQKPTFYIITLTLSIISNYYMSYMLCLFCVIYFIYKMLLKYSYKEDKKQIITITKNFVISSLLSGLICSFFLIPCFIEMLNYGRNVMLSEIIKFDYNFFDIFSKTYIGSLNLENTLNYSSMNIYCTVAVIPLVYLYLINKKIPRKERKYTFLLILFLILPCFIYPLNYIWHLFTIPSFYSYRYSFLLCFILIDIAYKSYNELNISKLKILMYLSIYLIISFYFIIISSFSKYYEFLNYKLIWITLIILGLNFVIFSIKNNKIKNMLFISLMSIDMILNIYIIFNNSIKYSSETLEISYYQKIIDKYKNNERMEFLNTGITYNDSLLLGYRGISNFLSTTNINNLNILEKLNYKYDTEANLYVFIKNSYIENAILGIKTVISNEEVPYYILKEKQNDIKLYYMNDVYIYENPNYLSIGYIINEKCNNIEENFLYDQELLNCITGDNVNYYKEYPIDKEKNTVNIKNKGDVYFVIDDILNKNVMEEIYFDNIKYYNEKYIIFQNNVLNNKINLNKNANSIDDLKIYYLDSDLLNEKLNQYKNKIEQLDYTISNNKINGKINTKGGIMMLTIPYEKGFKIYIDDKLVDYFEVADKFVGINIQKGVHTIEVTYHQPGINIGIVCSIISIITCGLYITNYRKGENHEKNI